MEVKTSKGKSKTNQLKNQVKELGYDSLCLRYRIAREAQMEYEIYKAKKDGNLRKEEQIKSMCERDCIAFYKVAYDAIGLNREGDIGS